MNKSKEAPPQPAIAQKLTPPPKKEVSTILLNTSSSLDPIHSKSTLRKRINKTFRDNTTENIPSKCSSPENYISQDSLTQDSNINCNANSASDGFICGCNMKSIHFDEHLLEKEENTQLICYKDQTKCISIQKDRKKLAVSKSSMFRRNKQKTIVKYKVADNFEIDQTDTNMSTFKLSKYESRHRVPAGRKHDIICDTVDAWATQKNKQTSVLSSIKNSLFGQKTEKVYKPLVFGGTYPIDVPCNEINEEIRKAILTDKVQVNHPRPKKCNDTCCMEIKQQRFYAQDEAPRTYDIDAPFY